VVADEPAAGPLSGGWLTTPSGLRRRRLKLLEKGVEAEAILGNPRGWRQIKG